MADRAGVPRCSPARRRVSVAGEIPVKELFRLFSQKPAKKMAYIAGLPMPRAASDQTVRTDTPQPERKRNP